MLSQPILHITDPAIARELMFDKANEFPDRGVSAMANFSARIKRRSSTPPASSGWRPARWAPRP